MGYTHYWSRPERLDARKFAAIADDFNKIVLALADAGVQLGDSAGEGVPIINKNEIVFNGLANCGHPENSSVVIPWPTDTASGITENSKSAEAGSWFAGTRLESRCCNGDCSYETFDLPRIYKPEYRSDDPDGFLFSCCKTAFRPYDLAVTAVLLIAKHHLGKNIRISSDGRDAHWQDAKYLCWRHLGYGADYLMGRELSKRLPDEG